MGVVYLGECRAEPGEPDRKVAIKTMARHLFSDPAERARFLREARIAARIRHPNVVAALELVTAEDGEIWHAMEYVDGLPLDALVRAARQRGERIPFGIALRIFVDILHGLGAAYHACQDDGTPLHVVHRDVSPANVLIGRHDGIARVLDFGIAKTATHSTTESADGFRGKVRYVAPEQIKGLPAGHASDVYSACVVAWEMFAGRPLFQGETEAITVTRVLVGTVPSLLDIDPELPAALDECLRGAIVPEPERRPEDAEALAEQLERSLSPASREELARYVDALKASVAARPEPATAQTKIVGEPLVEERPAPVASVPPPSPTRRPWTILGAAALAIVLVGGGGVVLGRVTFSKAAPVGDAPAPAPNVSTVSSTMASAVEGAVAEPSPSGVAAAPDAEAAPAAEAAPEPAATSSTARAETKVAPPPRRPSNARTKSVDCRVPTYIDSRGISRIRTECL